MLPLSVCLSGAFRFMSSGVWSVSTHTHTHTHTPHIWGTSIWPMLECVSEARCNKSSFSAAVPPPSLIRCFNTNTHTCTYTHTHTYTWIKGSWIKGTVTAVLILTGSLCVFTRMWQDFVRVKHQSELFGTFNLIAWFSSGDLFCPSFHTRSHES